ncbi:MAG TPA: TIM barrel protein [Actinomycetota bacterium]|nr:TIM barrel protein [Actinomycetota bacterium]
MNDGGGISRRKFLGAGAIAGGGTILGASNAFAGTSGLDVKGTPFSNYTGDPYLPKNLIGLMLYTVRDQVDSVGFAEVFETVAGMGYTAVEFAGYTQGTGDITPKQIRKLMEANGLVGVGSHGNLDDAAIEAAVALDMPYTGTAFEIPRDTSTAGWEQLAADYNAFGQKAAKHGVRGYLHIHGPAYGPVADNPDIRGLDILLEQTDPKFFAFEMDIYWAYFFRQTFPGYDPITWVKDNRDRFPLFHVKDGIHDGGEPDFRDVGQGNVPFEEFFKSVKGARKSWYLNERDSAADHPRGSFCSAQASYLYMRYGLRK